jgi:hypothetical protein
MNMPGSSPEKTEITGETVEVEKTETKAPETTTDVQSPAESSTAEVKDDKGDMLSAVKAALKPKTEKPSDSNEPGSESGEAPAATAEKEGAKEGTDPEDLTEDELAHLRPKTRKRIDNLLRDRAERDRKISEIEPKAEQFEKITGFVQEAGLSKDEVNDGFAVMRDLKREPYKAYQRLKPIMAQLANMFGEGELPQDLHQDVVTGRITEQRARELVNARSQTTLATTQAEENARLDRERRDQEAHTSNVNSVATAVTEWERSKEKTDPSWKLKQPRVMEIVEIEIARRQRTNPTYFPTKDEALKFSTDALAKVETEMKAFTPRPRAINPVTDAGSTRSVAKPANAVEAAKLALSQAG